MFETRVYYREKGGKMFVRGDRLTCELDEVTTEVYFRYLNAEGHAVVEDCTTGKSYTTVVERLAYV